MLVRTLVARAREHAETVMPGTTHARAAQPVTLGHHLLAHAWALLRDLERFDQAAVRTSVSPLGAAALATSTLGLDPTQAATELGFRRAFDNSIDAVSDRDFVQEFLADAAICATHLSRLAADLARWTDPALGWAELDEAYTTGSSIMPQKRNPDTAELARAKAARIAGGFVALTSVLQGLPLGYHRDLQEDKEPAFDAADTLELVLPALVGAVDSMRFDVAAMRAVGRRRGALRHRPRRGARARRPAVPRGPPADRSAVEGARRARPAPCATSPRRSGRRSASPAGQRCSTRTRRCELGPCRADRPRRA